VLRFLSRAATAGEPPRDEEDEEEPAQMGDGFIKKY
jgi:hypothetical protein